MDDLQRSGQNTLSWRLLNSYGVWSEMRHMMTQAEYLKLQALSRYMYSVAIGRS